MSISLQDHTIHPWWSQLRHRLTIFYFVVALTLVVLSGAGHIRLLSEVGKIFGGFYWIIDDDTDRDLVVVSTPTQLPPLRAQADSLINTLHIVAVNKVKTVTNISQIYLHAHEGDPITYTILQNRTFSTFTRSATKFTLQMWWQQYGLASLAGLCWLIVGGLLLTAATEWTEAVEGITLLPVAMFLLLSSSCGNVQQADSPNMVLQLLWLPSIALLGSVFIHVSLIYRPGTLGTVYAPKMAIDGLPYLPPLVLLAYEWSTFITLGHIPASINLIACLGYAAVGAFISSCIGVASLLRISRFFFHKYMDDPIPPPIRRRIGNILLFWLMGICLVFCFGLLPMMLIKQTLLSLPEFYVLAAVYPLFLFYIIRSQRQADHLHIVLQQQEETLHKQQKIEAELRQTNRELKQATSFLLQADVHLRSTLSQRIHDQPRQQTLRIRSLLGHWQHKLRVEAQRVLANQETVQPLLRMLDKARKISKELENDLRGLQLLVEDVYQRQSLGLKPHLEQLIHADLPLLHSESSLKIEADLWALDALSPDLEQSEAGVQTAEAISYTVTQALLNVYNHAGATYAIVRTTNKNDSIEVSITDDGHGFDVKNIPPEKTSLLTAQLKVQEAGGVMTIRSTPRPQAEHGTTVMLRVPYVP